MNKENFTRYLTNPESLNSNSLFEIKEIVTTYPYFQTAQILYTLNLLKLHHKDYTEQLALASSHLSNRKLLKQKTEELFKRETFTSEASIEIKNKASTSLPEINEVTESPIAEVSFAIQENNEINEDIHETNPLLTNELKEETTSNQLVDLYKIEDNNIVVKIEDETSILNQNNEKTVISHSTDTTNNQDLTTVISNNEKEIQPNKEEIIDKFIKGKPKINALQSNKDYSTEIDKHSLTENDDFVSETLALVYEKQGYYTKAIKIYHKLILEFPEKSSFFASRIEKLKNTSNQ